MEILSFNYIPSCHVNSRWKLVDHTSSSHPSVFLTTRPQRVLCAGLNSKRRSLSFSDLDGLFVNRSNQDRVSSSRVYSNNSGSCVITEKDDERSITKRVESLDKIFIPSLPNESNDDHGSPISSCYWEYKPKLKVHYEKAGCENVKSPPVLFLPGFGVGSFHYEKQLKDLGRDFRVWAVDFLGQGMSLPSEPEEWANELVFSVDLWQDQVQRFVEEVIGEPVYVVGNSLGGYVALCFAASTPELVKGVALLNATPFWGFLPNPTRNPRLARMFPWAGGSPLPPKVKKFIEFIWQKFSEPESIAKILRQVYVDHTIKVDKVFSRIIQTTQHPAAAASFAAIMLAPQGQLSFDDAVSRCQENKVSICLMYGKEDPWVKPLWGLKVKRQLPETPFYEISPAGHCPHDEVPEVVNYLLRGWIGNLESQGYAMLPLLDNAEEANEYGVFRDLEFVREGSRKSVRVRYFGTKFALWSRISSFIKSRIGDLGFSAS